MEAKRKKTKQTNIKDLHSVQNIFRNIQAVFLFVFGLVQGRRGAAFILTKNLYFFKLPLFWTIFLTELNEFDG